MCVESILENWGEFYAERIISLNDNYLLMTVSLKDFPKMCHNETGHEIHNWTAFKRNNLIQKNPLNSQSCWEIKKTKDRFLIRNIRGETCWNYCLSTAHSFRDEIDFPGQQIEKKTTFKIGHALVPHDEFDK